MLGELERPAQAGGSGARAMRRIHRAPWRVVAARVLVNGLAVAVVVLVLPGVRETTARPVLGYVLMGALFGLINAFVKPAIQFVALPMLAGSMGLVVIVVDILTFWLLAALTNVLTASGLLPIVLGGTILGLLSFLLDNLLGLVPPVLADRRAEEWTR
jgi:putative membrane protein